MAWTVLTLCVPRLADAQEKSKAAPFSVTLDYEAPSQCRSVGEFRAIVRKRLNRDPFVEASTNRVFVAVSPLDGELSGEIVWRDDQGNSTGQQSFPSTTNHCAQLVDAMAFALAVQIHLLETVAVENTKSASEEGPRLKPSLQKDIASATSSPGREPSSVAPHASHASPEPRRPAALFIGGGAGLAVGMSSQVVPEGRLFAGLRWTAVSIELGLEGSAPVITRRADGAGFSQWYLLASAAGCASFQPWSVCALMKLGTVQVTGRDIDVPNGTGALVAQGGLRLALRQRLSARTFVSLRSEGLVNLKRWSVLLDGIEVSNTPRFAWVSGLDLAFHFQ
ncbi:MAG TPA: hypothetical protein VJV79_24830 [Polyangiaceae bacterium]|nr:hypothetical protein [Polyangiaceae bacterium]